MKSLHKFINETLIVESVCKDINNIKKGNILYVHAEGKKDITPLKVINVISILWDGCTTIYDCTVEFAENSVLKGFTYTKSKRKDTDDQVSHDLRIYKIDDKLITMGTSKEIVEEAIKDHYDIQLRASMKKLEKAREDLRKAQEDVDKYAASLGVEISKKLEESRQA